MAQLLLIKTADTPLKRVGDIVGKYEDTHKFFEHVLLIFNVLQIPGTRKEVDDKLKAIKFRYETAYKAESDVWTRTRPDEKLVWKDTDEKYYFLEERPKYMFSLAGLTVAERTILETEETGLQRDIVFKKMVVNPGEWDAKNTVEAKDLNV